MSVSKCVHVWLLGNLDKRLFFVIVAQPSWLPATRHPHPHPRPRFPNSSIPHPISSYPILSYLHPISSGFRSKIISIRSGLPRLFASYLPTNVHLSNQGIRTYNCSANQATTTERASLLPFVLVLVLFHFNNSSFFSSFAYLILLPLHFLFPHFWI